jgi:hypothetical protein
MNRAMRRHRSEHAIARRTVRLAYPRATSRPYKRASAPDHEADDAIEAGDPRLCVLPVAPERGEYKCAECGAPYLIHSYVLRHEDIEYHAFKESEVH